LVTFKVNDLKLLTYTVCTDKMKLKKNCFISFFISSVWTVLAVRCQ